MVGRTEQRENGHQKTALTAVLVNLTGILNDWPDNLKGNITQEGDIVKSENYLSVDLPGVEPGRFGLSGQSSKPAKPTPSFTLSKPLHHVQIHLRGVKAHLGGVLACLFLWLFLAFPQSAIAANSGIFSMELWVKPTSSIASQALIGKAEEIRMFTDSSGYVGCQIKATTWQTAATATTNALSLNTWTHVACSYDKANIKIFVNGVQVATQAETDTPDDTSAAFEIGEDDSASTPYSNLTGVVDGFEFYNYALTAKQIVSDMNAGHPAVGSPVGSAVGHWKLDQGYGTNADDSTPNNNDLTLSSASWTNSGKFGKAWNGTGALWLSRADDSDFDVTATDDYSISLWYKTDSGSNPGAVEYLFNKASATIAGYAVYANTSGNLCFGIDDDTTWNPDIASCTSTDVYDNTWHHLLAVRDTVADKTLIYIDGDLKDSDEDTTSATLANSLLLYVGDRDGTDNGDEFNGDIDEIKVYRYALTADEVKTEYNRGSSLVLGALGNLSTLSNQAAGQEYCVPGDTASCVSPVGEWKFEEKTGTTANDTSINEKTATITAGTGGWTNGKVGAAYSFDNANTKVETSSTYAFPTTMTIEAWIFPKSTGEGALGAILDLNQGALDFRVQATNALLLRYPWSTGRIAQPSANNVLSLNTWQHVAVSYNGGSSSNRPIFYVNGKEVSNGTDGSNNSGAVSAQTDTWVIGNTELQNQTFDGFIDQVKVFDYIRTPAQVAYDYNRGGPVGHWKFDECQGSTAYDSSGNSNTGTITIGASGTQTAVGTCTSSGAWFNGVTGKRNYSLNFDGTDDYITMGSPTNLGLSGNQSFTLSVWAKPSATRNDGSFISYGAASNNRVISINANGSGKIYSVHYGNDNAFATAWDTSGVWQHVVITYDGTTERLYVNGTYRESWTPSALSLTSGDALYVGRATWNGTYVNTTQIDDPRVYNYALTATQVKEIYNSGALFFGPSTGSP